MGRVSTHYPLSTHGPLQGLLLEPTTAEAAARAAHPIRCKPFTSSLVRQELPAKRTVPLSRAHLAPPVSGPGCSGLAGRTDPAEHRRCCPSPGMPALPAESPIPAQAGRRVKAGSLREGRGLMVLSHRGAQGRELGQPLQLRPTLDCELRQHRSNGGAVRRGTR